MSHWLAPSGINWSYLIEGNGEVLIFLHGWGVDRRIWRQQTKAFSKSYCVVAIDLPGHGESQWGNISLDIMAQEIVMLLKRENINHISIVSSSLGGLFALKIYAISPLLIKRLAFVGSLPKFSKSQDFPYGLDIERIRKLGGQLHSNYPSIVNIFFRSLFTKKERASRRFRWLQKFRQTDDIPMKQALVDYLDVLEKEDLRNILKVVRVPIQFINGLGDEICSPQAVAFLQTICPHARYYNFEHCGHFPFLSEPYLFNDVLKKFFEDTKDYVAIH